jgi:cytochrome c553
VTIKSLRWAMVIGFALSSGAAMAAGNIQAGKAKAAMCMSCHGAQGISAVPTYPNLAGQKEAYLVKALKEYKDGQRQDATMKAMAAPLSAADIQNLAAYFSSLKPGK